MGMQTQIQRLRDAKEAMRLSIIAKGVDVPISAKIDTYPSYIAQIVRSRQRATFAVTDDITQYTSTEFVDVFDRATGKWYKLNNLNQFEPYGVYGNSPDGTKYVGKLIVYNGNEYEWTGSDWRYIGQVEGEDPTSVYPKEYTAIAIPTPPPASVTFNTMEDALGYTYVYYGLLATIGGSQYVYNSNNEWQSLSFGITGTKVGSGAMSLKINGTDVNVEVLYPVADYYKWSYDWDTSIPVTSITKGNTNGTDIVSIDWSNLDVSQWTSMSKEAFRGCSSLALTSLPSGVTSIGQLAFYNCSSLALTSLPSGVTSIGRSAFVQCSSLALTSLPSGVTSILDYTFAACSSLASVSMPSVTSIGQFAFQSCSSLASVSMPSVTSIGAYAFTVCTSLASVYMPSVTSIGNGAFQSCSSLASVSMPNVTTIGDNAFRYCSSLASVSMPSVTSIDSYAFVQCSSLASIDIPSSVTSIGNAVFNSSTSIASVICRATTPPTLGTYVFTNTHTNLVIYVPAESVEAYKSATNWSEYADKIQAIPE